MVVEQITSKFSEKKLNSLNINLEIIETKNL